jgi:hypothetical protein
MFHLKFRCYTRGDYSCIVKYIQIQGMDDPFCELVRKIQYWNTIFVFDTVMKLDNFIIPYYEISKCVV